MRNLLNRIPVVRALVRFGYYGIVSLIRGFSGSDDYWKKRYQAGGNSGAGSYGALAQYKADVLNDFVREHGIVSVLEFGCGDGNQLTLAHYPRYTGLDISPEAIALCRKLFAGDTSKQFLLLADYRGETAELSLSLDVIYHLVEDAVFEEYMRQLFAAATRFVIVYSSDTDVQQKLQLRHVRNRKFTTWVEQHQKGWHLARHIPNRYQYNRITQEGSFADFFIFAKNG